MSLLLSAAVLTQQAGEAWSYYRTVTVDNTGGAAHTDWPVLVSLTSGNFTFANADTNGDDLQFRATDGETVLSHWIEAYDDASDTASVWVKVPSIPADDTVDVRLYYGNAGAVRTSSPDGVFLVGEDFREAASVDNVASGSIADSPAPLLFGEWRSGGNDAIAIHGGAGWRAQEVREQSNIVWTGTEYVILVTGKALTSDCDVGLYYASEIDGGWTEYASNPVIQLAEDPYICVNTDGSLYTDVDGWHYVMYERKTAGIGPSQVDTGISRTKNFRTDWQSWDGSTWGAVDSHVAVLEKGAAATWDETFTASPCVVHDGTQFVCIYEGANSTPTYRTGVARSTDGVTWTKEASNPISTLEVIDDAQLIDGTWWMTGHGNGGNQYRYRTTDAPADWDSASLTYDPAKYYTDTGNSVNLAFGFDGCEKWATYQDGIGTDGINLYRWAGGSKWKPITLDGNAAGIQSNSVEQPQGVFDAGHLRIGVDPGGPTSAAWGLVSASTIGAASDFEIISSKRQLDGLPGGGDDCWSTFAIGTGATPARDGSLAYVYQPNGYVFSVLSPGVAGEGAVIREYGASSATGNIGSAGTVSAADANVFLRHQMSYRSGGQLSYSIGGTVRNSGTDATHVSGNKYLSISSGHANSRNGGNSEFEWLVVRPFDGLDPSASVGSETTL